MKNTLQSQTFYQPVFKGSLSIPSIKDSMSKKPRGKEPQGKELTVVEQITTKGLVALICTIQSLIHSPLIGASMI